MGEWWGGYVGGRSGDVGVFLVGMVGMGRKDSRRRRYVGLMAVG